MVGDHLPLQRPGHVYQQTQLVMLVGGKPVRDDVLIAVLVTPTGKFGFESGRLWRIPLTFVCITPCVM